MVHRQQKRKGARKRQVKRKVEKRRRQFLALMYHYIDNFSITRKMGTEKWDDGWKRTVWKMQDHSAPQLHI